MSQTVRNLAPHLEWIDISVPLHDAMVHWPSDPPVRINRVKDIEQGGTSNVSAISMGAHSGTHMDAPVHFFSQGNGIDSMPLGIVIGQASVIGIDDAESIKPDELSRHGIRCNERVLFKTSNSSEAWKRDRFAEDFVFLSDEAADFLIERGVKVVGVDYLSVGGFRRGGRYVHERLLGNRVWIIEGLDLSSASPGRYEMVCLPRRISRGDGAPARAILRPIRGRLENR